ncbi:hypothetical protein [Chryseobacterium proteolyticum]|uniref:hypothetical protein n=1 Tax=Chryseobacterium proteolyticum TaxID=118127 RepID=UPI003983647F
MWDFIMFIKFTTVNKKAHHSDIERMLWEKTEEAIKNQIRSRLRRAKDDLEGLNLHVEIDMQNSNAKLIGEGIPENKIELAENAFKKM